MIAGEAKAIARQWVATHADTLPGLRAAHLTGGLTSMPDDAHFPAHKDVDMHLIFEAGSPALDPTGNGRLNNLEIHWNDINIEAGIKSTDLYQSPEAVLSNPEIAYHLTVDSLLYDPDGLLGELQNVVKRDYARRKWVLARIEHERRGLATVPGFVEFVSAQLGGSGEVSLLGYSTTFPAASLWVATLKPPKMGGSFFVRVREILGEYDRLDLYDGLLDVLGIREVDPQTAQHLLNQGAEAFDLALSVKQSPHPFEHKLHAHLRPYFVDTCQIMLDTGYHREALSWTIPYYLGCCDVILADAPVREQSVWGPLQADFLRRLGLETAAKRQARFAYAFALYDQFFALAEEIIDRHPAIID